MVLVAQIIVDVPLMQTDRPYSYLIPVYARSNCHWYKSACAFW